MGARPLISFLKNANSGQTESEEEKDEKQEQEQQEALTPEEAVKAFKKDYALKLGWTEKETWEASGRDGNIWRDYEDFLENSPTYFERLRKKSREQENRMKRNAQAAAAAIEETARQTRADAEREAREAATAGDPDRAAAAVAKVAASPPAETVAWIGRNSWFNEDPGARALAVAEVDKLAAKGVSVAEQLEAAEAIVKKRFPEYFENEDDELPDFITKPIQRHQETQEERKREVRMSESSKVAAAASSSAAASARNRDTKVTKEKTFKDIPAQDQALYEKHFARRFVSQGLKVEEARERYAKSYFKNQS